MKAYSNYSKETLEGIVGKTLKFVVCSFHDLQALGGVAGTTYTLDISGDSPHVNTSTIGIFHYNIKDGTVGARLRLTNAAASIDVGVRNLVANINHEGLLVAPIESGNIRWSTSSVNPGDWTVLKITLVAVA